MSDPLHIVHSEEQPTFAELRGQYRAENRARVHATLREDVITFRDKDGFFLRHADGKLVKKKSGYLTDAPVEHPWHRRLDEARAEGQRIPEFSNEFIIPASAGLDRELRDLARDAKLLDESERVTHPAERVGDPPLADLSDESVVTYLDAAKEAK